MIYGRYTSEAGAQAAMKFHAIGRQERWRVAYIPDVRYVEYPWVLIRDPWQSDSTLPPAA